MKIKLAICSLFTLCVSFLIAQVPEGFSVVHAPKRWALCIGAGDYKSLSQLKYAAKDAIDFSEFLVKDYGFSKDTVTVLSDQSGYEPPTSLSVNRALDKALSDPELDRGDQFILFFSGHGAGLADGDYWLPTDVTVETRAKNGIRLRNVVERLTKAGLRNIVIIADACRAGQKNNFGNELIELGRKANIAVMLGCQPGQKSYELSKFKQGAFTFSLLRALKNPKLADPISGALWASDLGAAVAKNVETNTKQEYGDNAQRPVIFAEKNQDVALAVLPKSSETDAEVTADEVIKNMGTPFNAGRRQGLVLSIVAFLRNQEGKTEEALKLLEAVDALGDVTDLSILNYVALLGAMGRTGDIDRLLIRHVVNKPLSKRRALATVMGTPSAVGEEFFVSALNHLKPDVFVDPWDVVAFQLYARENKLNQTKLEVANYLQSILVVFKDDSECTEMLEGLIADRRGNPGLASKIFESLISKNLKRVDREYVYKRYIPSLISLGDVDKTARVLSEAIEKYPKNDNFRYYDIFFALVMNKKRGITLLKNYLNEATPNVQVTELVVRTGSDIKEVLPEALSWVKKYPASPNAASLGWFISCLENATLSRPISPELIKLSTSREGAILSAYSLVDMFLTTLSQEKDATDQLMSGLRRQFVTGMLLYLPSIEKDRNLYLQLARQLNQTDMPVTTWNYLCVESERKKLWVEQEQEILEERYVAALNMGDQKYLDALWTKIQPKASEQIRLHRATFLVLSGDFKSAQDLVPALKQASDATTRDLVTLLEIFIELKLTGKESAMKMVELVKDKKFNYDDRGTLLMRTLEYELSGEERALALTVANLGFGAPRDLALRVAVLKLLKGRFNSLSEAGRQLVNLKGVPYLLNYPGLWSLRSETLPEKTKLSDFVGTYEFQFTADNGLGTVINGAWLKVASDGAVKGKVDGYQVVGQVDANGNFEGDLINEGKSKTKVLARLVPLKLMTGPVDKVYKWHESILFSIVQDGSVLAQFKTKFVDTP